MEQIIQKVNFENDMVLASRWSRLGAAAIDYILLGFPYYFIEDITSNFDPKSLIPRLYIIIFAIIQSILLTKYGQSIGKMLINIKIVKSSTDENGGFLTNIILRTVLTNLITRFIPIFIIIDNLFIFSKEKRCLHDLIAGTKVVNS